ncbi:TPA: metal-sensing transcriptional repressor, partial [Streptococcus suis]|nr:metal-sensing transcriptional repressor [Streptococcus suis]
MKTEKKDILNRLKRAEGQLRGIQKMIDEEQECLDIVTQLTAVRSSINRTLGLVIGNKISQLMEHPEDNSEIQDAKIQQVLDM